MKKFKDLKVGDYIYHNCVTISEITFQKLRVVEIDKSVCLKSAGEFQILYDGSPTPLWVDPERTNLYNLVFTTEEEAVIGMRKYLIEEVKRKNGEIYNCVNLLQKIEKEGIVYEPKVS